MKKTNKFKGQTNSFRFGDHNVKRGTTTSTSTNFPAFLKWFKKNCERNTFHKPNGIYPTVNSRYSKNKEEIFPTTSSVLDHLSLNSSCDSVLSTSTTGFAFIEPKNYELYQRSQKQRSLSSEQLEIEKCYNSKQKTQGSGNVTLREKYCLYYPYTLSSNDITDCEYNNIYYFNTSVSSGKNKVNAQQICNRSLDFQNNCRRSASDNSRDKKSGAYVHVKGKRRAPPPPPLANKINLKKSELQLENTTENISENYDLISPGSTFGMKKRKAPLPPFQKQFNSHNSTLVDNLHDDKEIRTFTEKSDCTPNNFEMPEQVSQDIRKSCIFSNRQIVTENNALSNTPLHESNNKNDTNELLIPSPLGSCYKHSFSTNKEDTVHFKEENVLKAMEYKKSEIKDNEYSITNLLPEVEYSRSSLFNTGYKIGLFFKHRDNAAINKIREKEKYRSSIGIPNISELDREAAQIVSKEYESKSSEMKDELNKSIQSSENFSLKNDMSEPVSHFKQENITNQINKPISTKVENYYSIIKENAQNKIQNKEEISEQSEHSNNTSPGKGKNEKTKNTVCSTGQEECDEYSAKTDEKIEYPKDSSWTCQFCTLKNPCWRILCNACERLRSYEESNIYEIKGKDSQMDKGQDKAEAKATVNLQCTNLQHEFLMQFDKLKDSTDWKTKAEKVKKYFASPNTKNPSKTHRPVSDNESSFYTKSSPNNVSLNNLPSIESTDQITTEDQDQPTNHSIQNEYSKLEYEKQPLLDSSVIITTVTPVFYATQITQTDKHPIVNEQKNTSDTNFKRDSTAIMGFSEKPLNMLSASAEERIIFDDPESLEREKKRLREKIRAMNAKVLTEKYPVMQKNTILDHNKINKSINSDKTIQEKNKSGAIKKIFNNKSNLGNAKQHDGQLFDNPSHDRNESHAHLLPPKLFKPEKVSTSVQTAGFLKMDTANTDKIYTNVLTLTEVNGNGEFNIPNNILNNRNTCSTDVDLAFSLQNAATKINHTDTLALSKIIKKLEQAIEEGQDELAGKLAIDLAKMKVSLQVTKVKTKSDAVTNQNQGIIVDFFVEDKISQKGPIQILVTPLMTILELKQKTEKDFEIPIEIQRWFINGKLAIKNEITLLEYGVTDVTSKFHLQLSPLEKEEIEQKKINTPNSIISAIVPKTEQPAKKNDKVEYFTDNVDLNGATSLPLKKENKVGNNNDTWSCPLCTLHNPKEKKSCIACATLKPITNNIDEVMDNLFIPQELRKFLFGENDESYFDAELKNDLNKINSNKKTSEMLNIIKSKPSEIQLPNKNYNLVDLSSPNITKTKYRGVYNYNVNRILNNRMTVVYDKSIKKEKSRAPEPPMIKQANHYLELVKLECSDAVPNPDEFECPICFMIYKAGEGVILRDCLHTFCKECLSNTIKYSEEAEVKCPYMDAEYSCNSTLQEREIKSIVSKEIYEQHLAKSVRVAEHHIANAFHCKTPNCRGWCIYEDNVNEFKCPVCCITNCLMCRIIHDGLTCKQYQDRLSIDSDSNIEARHTKCMIEEMVEKGEAMKCPTCQIIMMKKWGCDWLKCSMCKTEICWVTRGPRWGPGGKGDTSGGCQCGVDGKKCHPKCNYCH